jgi:2-amino-4-hydroxy-6-hydroxymethyldihydropteridine diphosphokinase
MATHQAYLILGSNMGDRKQYIASALHKIAAHPFIQYVKTSSWYETAAWGKEDMPSHYNVATCIATTLTPVALLQALQQIELALDRERQEKWGQRTIDIDILFYDDIDINTKNLVIPHPYLHLRRFTLEPLNEIAPTYIHPVYNKSITTLLDECTDHLAVKKICI